LKPNHKSKSAFSLLELLISVAIVSFALGLPLALFRSSERMQSTVTTRAALQARARQTLDRIAGQLESSSLGVIPQSVLGAGLWTSTVDFQRAGDWNGASVDWSPAERIELVASPDDPNDGIDNDSNGLIDERIVLWTVDVGLSTESRRAIGVDVPEVLAGEIAGNGLDDNGNGLRDEAGLAFEFVGEQIVIRLSLQGRDSSKARIEHSEERRVAFRN
jgi:prepilin-type N-terminal cleavage/methylation domain-containing protein